MTQKKDSNFNYSYSSLSANEKKQVENIKSKYETHEESKDFQTLQKLDKKVKHTPKIIAFLLGGIGTLIFGTGFSMIMEWNLLLFGIIIGIVGLLLVIIAYPVYTWVQSKFKKNYGTQILELSDKLLKQNETNEANKD